MTDIPGGTHLLSLRAGTPLRAALGRFVACWAVLSVAFTLAGLLLVEVVLELGDLGARDLAINEWLAARRTIWVDRFTGFVSWLMDGPRAVVLTIVIVAAFTLRHRRSAAMLVAVGLLLEAAVFITVNALVGRPRPDVPHFAGVPSTSSFPSGHVAATLVVFGALAVIAPARPDGRANRWLSWLAVLIVVSAAFSRVYRGLHHVTDVTFGVLVGLTALVGAVYVVAAWEDRRAGNQTVDLRDDDRARAGDEERDDVRRAG